MVKCAALQSLQAGTDSGASTIEGGTIGDLSEDDFAEAQFRPRRGVAEEGRGLGVGGRKAMITAAADPNRFLSGGNDLRRAMTWAIVFALCWAVIEVGLGSQLRNLYPLLQIVWCRYAVHLGVATAIWAWRRPPMWGTERPAFHLARSLLMLTMPGAFVSAVMAGISAEFVWAVFWIAPLMIIALAGVALGERPPATVLIAAALGAVAAAAIFGHLKRRLALVYHVGDGCFAFFQPIRRYDPIPTDGACGGEPFLHGRRTAPGSHSGHDPNWRVAQPA